MYSKSYKTSHSKFNSTLCIILQIWAAQVIQINWKSFSHNILLNYIVPPYSGFLGLDWNNFFQLSYKIPQRVCAMGLRYQESYIGYQIIFSFPHIRDSKKCLYAYTLHVLYDPGISGDCTVLYFDFFCSLWPNTFRLVSLCL